MIFVAENFEIWKIQIKAFKHKASIDRKYTGELRGYDIISFFIKNLIKLPLHVNILCLIFIKFPLFSCKYFIALFIKIDLKLTCTSFPFKILI